MTMSFNNKEQIKSEAFCKTIMAELDPLVEEHLGDDLEPLPLSAPDILQDSAAQGSNSGETDLMGFPHFGLDSSLDYDCMSPKANAVEIDFSQIEPIPIITRCTSCPLQAQVQMDNSFGQEMDCMKSVASAPALFPSFNNLRNLINQAHVPPNMNWNIPPATSQASGFLSKPATAALQKDIQKPVKFNLSALLNSGSSDSQRALPPSKRKTKHMLPIDFEPTPYSVICGRGREAHESTGNVRFRDIVNLHLKEFIDAPDKVQKSNVVTKVISIIRKASPQGAFVKYEKGRWYEASDRVVREKVGALFRDCLPTEYKSSSRNKIERRRNRRSSVGGRPKTFGTSESSGDSFTSADSGDSI